MFHGIGTNMCELKDGSSAEAARELGKGWKVNPRIIWR